MRGRMDKEIITIRNKKGQTGDHVMIFPTIFLFLLIGGGIVAGVFVFFGYGYEFRQVDSDIINVEIKNCILEKGIEEIEKDKEGIFALCNMNKGALEQGKFMIKICEGIDGEECAEKTGQFFQFGSNFQACLIKANNKNYPKCTFTNVVVNEKKYTIITGSNQQSRRIQ